MARKIFFAKNWNGETSSNYYEIYTHTCLGYTFVVGQGIEGDKDFSIFYVTNDGHYEILDIVFASKDIEHTIEVILDCLQKEMKRVIKKDLRTRIKNGTITIEECNKIIEGNK